MRLTEAELKELGLNKNCLPRHIAMIMDGNGRWAKKNGYIRAVGHRAGVTCLKDLIRFCSDAGIEALTLYAFSTENWKRPAEELKVLFSLLVEFFNREIDELDENNVCIRSIGELSDFPKSVVDTVSSATKRTASNSGLKLNIALNYGSQAEIVRACQSLCKRALQTGSLPTKEDFEAELYTAGLPQLDLLIRTSGELRLSNYLLYQAAYAELYFTDVLWPDFSKQELINALIDYQKRNRRFGGLNP